MSKTLSAEVEAQLAEDTRSVYGVEIELDSGTQRYVAYAESLVFDGQTYTALPFTLSDYSTESTMQAGEMTVTLGDIGQSFIAQVLAAHIEFRDRVIRVRRFFLDYLDDPSNYILVFQGRIYSTHCTETAFEVRGRSSLAGLRRRGPKGTLQVSCNWQFGGVECTVDLTSAANKQEGTADAGSSNVLLVDAARVEADNYWNIGTLEILTGANAGFSRQILDFVQATGTITVDAEFPFAISPGDTYRVVRGCDQTLSTCKNKYDNRVNFGGFTSIPREIVKAS